MTLSEYQEFVNFVQATTSASHRPWCATLHGEQIVVVMFDPASDDVIANIPLCIDLDQAKAEIVRQFKGTP